MGPRRSNPDDRCSGNNCVSAGWPHGEEATTASPRPLAKDGKSQLCSAATAQCPLDYLEGRRPPAASATHPPGRRPGSGAATVLGIRVGGSHGDRRGRVVGRETQNGKCPASGIRVLPSLILL